MFILRISLASILVFQRSFGALSQSAYMGSTDPTLTVKTLESETSTTVVCTTIVDTIIATAQSTNQPSNTLATQAASLSPMSMMQTSDLSSLSIGMASTNTNVSTSSVVTIASELEASATPTESAILVTTSGSDLITISHGPKADLVGCPAWDGATWTPFSSDNETYKWDQNLPMSFDIFCQANIPAGQGENPAITDMWHLQTDTLQSCIDHCASYNGEYHDLTTYDMCSGVTWDVDNYCWMKRGFRNLGTSNYPLIFGPSGYASAIIIEPLNRANYKNDPAEFNSSWPNATHV